MIAGRYSRVREIGRGGSGVVWLGRDETLGRPVALKRIGLLPGADRTDLARAEREARLSARLHHPHVVLVYDVVEDQETGARWLVMEHVDGPTLEALVRERGRLGPDEAAPLLRQVADALVAAHAAGIAHRDVKPSNVLLEHGRVAKLADFGIARVASDPSLTQTGMVTGSPAYLAPEIATGRGGGAAADVWSLGATAYHVLAGHRPYDSGENVLGTLYRIVHEDPPRLDGAGWLGPLLAGTMVRDPAERWTMTQVRDHLLAGPRVADPGGEPTRVLPPAPAPPTPPAPPARRGRRRAAVLLAAALLAVAVLLALVVPLLGDGDGDGDGNGDGEDAAAGPPRESTGASARPSAGASPSASPTPTARGIADFVRRYVATVAADPDVAWTMLTPKFQRESGGLATYRDFWDSATSARVRSIRADPESLSVSYQVRFTDFDNGPGPTVLDLAFEEGTYRIDGERTAGFTPAG